VTGDGQDDPAVAVFSAVILANAGIHPICQAHIVSCERELGKEDDAAIRVTQQDKSTLGLQVAREEYLPRISTR